MESALWYFSLFAFMVLLARRSRGKVLCLRLEDSEESAHTAALLRRNRTRASAHPERRGERRYRTMLNATARILGAEGEAARCQILDISNRGMRIRSSAPVPADAELQVQWGDRFFIGTRRNQSVRAGDYIIGLQLISCNYTDATWWQSLGLHWYAWRASRS